MFETHFSWKINRKRGPFGLAFLYSILENQEAGSYGFIRNLHRFGQEAMLLILGCVSGKNILNEFPGIASSASLQGKSDLSELPYHLEG